MFEYRLSDTDIIKDVTAKEVAKLQKDNSSDYMFNKYPEGARFLGYFKKDECVGTAGWIVRGKRIELIGAIVAEDYRGQGIYRKLFQIRENLCWKLGCEYLYSYATRMSLPTFLKNGFVEKKRYNNTSYVRKDKRI